MGKYEGLRRFTTKRFILTVGTMATSCMFLWFGKLPPGLWVMTMMGSAAYHNAVDIINALKGVVIPDAHDHDERREDR